MSCHPSPPLTTPPVVEATSKKLSPWIKRLLLIILGLCLTLVVILYYFFATTTKQLQGKQAASPLEQLGMMFGSGNRPLNGVADDRINVLLLGIGGAGHDGPNLTDTIMATSIKPSTQQVALLSLPRDLIVKYYDPRNPKWYEGHKINNAYAWGGIDLATQKVTDVTGLTIHYYVIVDFSGFSKLVDDIGGIDITVERTFTGLYGTKDLTSPCPKMQLRRLKDGMYCAITFKQGPQHMDGNTALMFSRIRKLDPKSYNNSRDATDFARAQRQHLVLESYKAKLLSANTLLRPDRIVTTINDLGDHLKTNLQLWELAKLGQIILSIPKDQIISKVVDETTSHLVKSNYDSSTGAWNVEPTTGSYDYSKIQALAETIFTLPTLEPTPLALESATVQVLNGTTQTGLAARTAQTLGGLTSVQITTIGIGNAPGTRNVPYTLIYDLTNGKKITTLTALQNAVSGTVATSTQLQTLQASDPKRTILKDNVDFIIVLGNTTNTNETK